MFSDSLILLKWWLYILLLGIIFLPITQKYFGRFFDKGYAFSKVIAVTVCSYTVWLLSSIKFAKFNRSIIFIVILIFALINAYILYHKKKHPNTDDSTCITNRKLLSICIFEEVIFLILLIAWSYIRGIRPDIHGLEKFMDFGFVNAALRTDYMPPVDIWFAGKSINYYYFGHYTCAFLTKLTAISSAITYNLMMATVFASTFILSLSLAGNMLYRLTKERLRKVLIAGLISAFMVAFAGNLHGFLYAYAKPYADKNITHTQSDYKYFYPHSTRYIGHHPETDDKTIHEFPIYSFVVSDLHGHVSDIPYVITFIALIFALWDTQDQRKGADIKTIVLGALFLAVMYMTNAWDYPIYLAVTFGVLTAVQIRIGKNKDITKQAIPSKAVPLVIFAGLITLSQVLLIPFNMNFDMISSKIGIVWANSPLYQLLVLWGHQLFFSLCFIIFIIHKIMLYCKRPNKKEDNNKGFSGLLNSLSSSDVFCFVLIICAIALVIIPEIVFVKDIYQARHHRANTMFKLVYQAFILFGLTIGYIATRLLSKQYKPISKAIITIIFAIMLILPMLYPALAVKGYYGTLKAEHYKGLDGLKFLNRYYEDDYAAIQWLNNNVNGQPTILEANGDSYSDYCRISMATGLPTIQGWYVHEWLWRNSSQLPKERIEEVAAVYEGVDKEAAIAILKKYNVKYIIIGTLEINKFTNINMVNLLSLGDIVFDSEKTKIIQVKDL